MSTFDETFNGEKLNIITQTSENGTNTNYEFLYLIDLDAKEYVGLLPADAKGSEDDVNVMIFEVHPLAKENKDYISIKDIAIHDKEFEEFKESFKDKFDFDN